MGNIFDGFEDKSPKEVAKELKIKSSSEEISTTLNIEIIDGSRVEGLPVKYWKNGMKIKDKSGKKGKFLEIDGDTIYSKWGTSKHLHEIAGNAENFILEDWYAHIEDVRQYYPEILKGLDMEENYPWMDYAPLELLAIDTRVKRGDSIGVICKIQGDNIFVKRDPMSNTSQKTPYKSFIGTYEILIDDIDDRYANRHKKAKKTKEQQEIKENIGLSQEQLNDEMLWNSNFSIKDLKAGSRLKKSENGDLFQVIKVTKNEVVFATRDFVVQQKANPKNLKDFGLQAYIADIAFGPIDEELLEGDESWMKMKDILKKQEFKMLRIGMRVKSDKGNRGILFDVDFKQEMVFVQRENNTITPISIKDKLYHQDYVVINGIEMDDNELALQYSSYWKPISEIPLRERGKITSHTRFKNKKGEIGIAKTFNISINELRINRKPEEEKNMNALEKLTGKGSVQVNEDDQIFVLDYRPGCTVQSCGNAGSFKMDNEPRYGS